MIIELKKMVSISACLIIPLFIAFSLLTGTCHAKRVTFAFDKHSMEDVAKQLSSQLNCRVVIDKELAGFSVSGHFMNITLQDFFSRIFRKINVAVLYDENKKLISIRSFGLKSEVIDRTGTGLTGSETDVLESSDAVREIEPGVLLQEIDIEENGFEEKEIEPGVLYQEMDIDETGFEYKEVEPGVLFQEMDIDEADFKIKEVEPGILF